MIETAFRVLAVHRHCTHREVPRPRTRLSKQVVVVVCLHRHTVCSSNMLSAVWATALIRKHCWDSSLSWLLHVHSVHAARLVLSAFDGLLRFMVGIPDAHHGP